eukprot:6209320-Pleurochrysis_carterae.AAC.2
MQSKSLNALVGKAGLGNRQSCWCHSPAFFLLSSTRPVITVASPRTISHAFCLLTSQLHIVEAVASV